jgi:hypothetical protein
MFTGLPGGSPGPDAEGSPKTLLFMFVLALVAVGAMLWFFLRIARDFGG